MYLLFDLEEERKPFHISNPFYGFYHSKITKVLEKFLVILRQKHSCRANVDNPFLIPRTKKSFLSDSIVSTTGGSIGHPTRAPCSFKWLKNVAASCQCGWVQTNTQFFNDFPSRRLNSYKGYKAIQTIIKWIIRVQSMRIENWTKLKKAWLPFLWQFCPSLPL